MAEDLSGLLLVDKPAGISSFDCIRRLRRATGQRKFGHTGTLDPMATGLMLILMGRATKRASELSRLDKTYDAVMTLGAVSSSGDREGELTAVSQHQPELREVSEAVAAFVGDITQIPPALSAVRVGGVRAYKIVRAGREINMPPRHVTIHEVTDLSYDYPQISFSVHVSSGTYIRSLAQDIGQKLETGAYLSSLRRTSVGEYSINVATPLDEINKENLEAHLIQI